MSAWIEGIVIGAASTTIGGIMLYFLKKKLAKRDIPDFDLDRFTEMGKEHVGIRNTDRKSIDACLILADVNVCRWWDDKSDSPRIIASGGGGNVILPVAGESNPWILVKSRKRTLRRIRYMEISLRK